MEVSDTEAQTKLTSDQNLDILKALMEETDIRIAEVKRDAYEFRRQLAAVEPVPMLSQRGCLEPA